MSTSLGYSREETFDDDQILEPKAAAIDEPRFNSHRQQIFKTAGEMILLALEQGWKVVKIEEALTCLNGVHGLFQKQMG